MTEGLVYYNEHNRYCVAWLRNLIAFGYLPHGYVDERDIQDVKADDLVGFRQCHFFAGIGGWPLALQWANWPNSREVWTGSCPCQPFSSAARGRNKRLHCERHLWPEWKRLIAARKPREILGEQVAQAEDWFTEVCNDVEALGYKIGAAILPAFSVGKDHKRERIYFAGYTNSHSQSSVPIHEETPRLLLNRGESIHVETSNGVSSQMGALRAYGNAIVPELATEFIGAYMEAVGSLGDASLG